MDEKQRISGESPRNGESSSVLPTVNPATEKPEPPKSAGIHPAFYITTWIAMSSTTILFNKWILHTLNFPYPIILTTWHLAFGTLMTQLLARTTTLLDGRKKVKMTGRVYLRAIVPIGFFFSLSLICGNVTYLYLSVAFIQMLKVSLTVLVEEMTANSELGYDSRRRSLLLLGFRHGSAEYEKAGQRVLHCLGSDNCVLRRDPLRFGRVSLPGWRCHFRGHSSHYGRKTPLFL